MKRFAWFFPLTLGLFVFVSATGYAETFHLMCSMKAKVNLDGRILGTYDGNTPLKIVNISEGDHKLYCKSTQTHELRLIRFTVGVTEKKEHKEFVRFHPPAKKRANVKSRRRTVLGVLGLANEALGSKDTGREDRRKLIVGAAVASEVLTKTRRRGDKDFNRRHGNTLVIKAEVPLMVNLAGVTRKKFKSKDKKEFHRLPSGRHKLYLRNVTTGELRTFFPEFVTGDISTVTIRPKFAPPDRGRTNEKSRRRNTIAFGAIANELFGRGRGNRKDIRKGLVAGLLGNEFLSQDPKHYYRRHKPVIIDLGR